MASLLKWITRINNPKTNLKPKIMNKIFKSTKVVLLVVLFTAFACKKDDNGEVVVPETETEINININITDLTVTLDENPTDGQVVGTVETDASEASNFSITSQTPSGALSIDSNTGEVTIANAVLFDFETNPAITATVTVDDAVNPATVTVNLNNLDEISAQDLTVAIDENPTDGQVVGAIQVTGSGTLSFSIASQTPAGALNIDAGTGELTVLDPNLFDFETNPVLTATVLIDNAVITTEVTATINLTDLDEVSAENSTITINENPTNGDVIGSVQATGGNLNFTITFQNPSGALEIDASTGELTVADAALFDFETYPNMLATVSVENAVNIVSVNATVNLINQNEVGDFFGGGIVFWVDPANNTHGLICAPSDNSIGVAWGSNTISVPIANDTSIGAGAANTAAIVAANTAINTAADVVANASINGFNDWFLPSRDELYQIFLNQTIINTTALANGGASLGGTLWSSSQFSNSVGTAYFLGVSNGSLNGTGKLAQLNFRAVRAF